MKNYVGKTDRGVLFTHEGHGVVHFVSNESLEANKKLDEKRLQLAQANATDIELAKIPAANEDFLKLKEEADQDN